MKKLGKILWDYWMVFAHKLGEVNQFILLGIVYFLVIGIYSILAWPFRFFGKPAKSSWHNSPVSQNEDQLTRPF